MKKTLFYAFIFTTMERHESLNTKIYGKYPKALHIKQCEFELIRFKTLSEKIINNSTSFQRSFRNL
jgi:hypothetical protein